MSDFYWWNRYGLLMKQRGVTFKIGNRVISGQAWPVWWWPLNWLGVPTLLIANRIATWRSGRNAP